MLPGWTENTSTWYSLLIQYKNIEMDLNMCLYAPIKILLSLNMHEWWYCCTLLSPRYYYRNCWPVQTKLFQIKLFLNQNIMVFIEILTAMSSIHEYHGFGPVIVAFVDVYLLVFPIFVKKLWRAVKRRSKEERQLGEWRNWLKYYFRWGYCH